jgi:hypothetical protein
LLAAAAAAALLLGAALYLLLRRSPAGAAELAAHLPPGEAPLIYADVRALRYSGLLDRLAGNPALEEPDYRRFVLATGFDYRRDLDGVLITWRGSTLAFLLAGRFDAEKLRAYAVASGGSCAGALCSLPASAPGRYLSFTSPRRGVLALAASNSEWAAAALGGRRDAPGLPTAPVWARWPQGSLRPGAAPTSLMKEVLEQFSSPVEATLTAGIEGLDLRLLLVLRYEDATRAGAALARLRAALEQWGSRLAGARMEAAAERVEVHWTTPLAGLEELLSAPGAAPAR